MDEENTGELDTLTQDEGNDSQNEDISTEDTKDYKTLYENQKARAKKQADEIKELKKGTNKAEKPAFDPEVIRNEARSTIREELDSQYLEESEYPDDIKDEIKRFAKLNNVSVRKAEKDEYIQYKIQKAVEEQRFDASAVRGTKKSVPAEDTNEFLDPKKFDLSTEEGRTAWKSAKAKRNRS